MTTGQMSSQDKIDKMYERLAAAEAKIEANHKQYVEIMRAADAARSVEWTCPKCGDRELARYASIHECQPVYFPGSF